MYIWAAPATILTFRSFCTQLNTNQGRYVVTSNGDLQIVQVHQSDSGTYVCVADNGLAPPVERDVELTVSGEILLLSFTCVDWIFFEDLNELSITC